MEIRPSANKFWPIVSKTLNKCDQHGLLSLQGGGIILIIVHTKQLVTSQSTEHACQSEPAERLPHILSVLHAHQCHH